VLLSSFVLSLTPAPSALSAGNHLPYAKEPVVNADLSVAPEIAQLAFPFVPAPHGAATAAPRTAGRLAGELTSLAAAPQRWWDLVRFDPDGPVRIPVPDSAGAWLLVVPPGAAADCDCTCATLIAGQASEAGRPLRPGRVLLHGSRTPHAVRGAADGYSVTLHGERKPLSGTGGGSSRHAPAITPGAYPESSLWPTRKTPPSGHTSDRLP
jgi:hypothetical protein